jgi:hypothetical protein
MATFARSILHHLALRVGIPIPTATYLQMASMSVSQMETV